MRTLSSMIAGIRSQTDEVWSAVDRMRTANRNLTGHTGETPATPRAPLESVLGAADEPLMGQLNTALERLNAATADLRSEITYFEGAVAETGSPMEYSKSAGVAAVPFR